MLKEAILRTYEIKRESMQVKYYKMYININLQVLGQSLFFLCYSIIFNIPTLYSIIPIFQYSIIPTFSSVIHRPRVKQHLAVRPLVG